jgi:hypothetical protein
MSRTPLQSAAGRLLLASFVIALAPLCATHAHSRTLVSGTFEASSPVQTGRVFRDGREGTCAALKGYPGETDTTKTFRYAEHPIFNSGPATCMSFKLVTSGICHPHLSIYLGAYNPANRAMNFVGDLGDDGLAGAEMSALIPANQWLTMVVTPTNPTTCAYSIAVDLTPAGHEFDADGKSDILWRQTSTGSVSLWKMDGSAIKNPPVSFGSVPGPWSVVGQRDFDGDANDDLLWRNTSTGDLAIWFLTFGGSAIKSTPVANVPPNWSIAGTGDLNADSRGDLLWRNTAGDTAVWVMNGATVAQAAGIGSVPPPWMVAAFADFDGDSRADILWRNTSTGQTAIWFMSGVTVTSSAVVGTVPTTWSVAATGDLDADGKADLIWRDTSGNVAVWMMSGSTVLRSAGFGVVPTSWTVAQTGDFNGDGNADLLWRDNSSNAVAIWFMDAVAVSSTASVATVPPDWVIQSANAN